MESGWSPANEVEREMAEALEAGDGPRFATTVMAAPLFLPVLPERGSERWRELSAQLPLDQPHVLVFTSPDAMGRLLGTYTRGHIQTDYASLLKRWPSPQFQLALNPGLPIGSVMAIGSMEALRTGKESLVSAEAVVELVEERINKRMRELCLVGLGLAAGTAPRPGPPANELEAHLAQAVAAADGEAFTAALWESEVVVPTTEPVPDPLAIHGEDGTIRIPWAAFDEAIPVFTSEEQLRRSSGSWEHFAVVPFLAMLAAWPDAEHVLCVNPGADTELMLDGETLLSILIELDQLPPDPDGDYDALPPAHPHDPPADDGFTAPPPIDLH
ncbi:SseB family protein [Allokutzneria sp. A3M-2-11 16]|uniref:SseB family protein n=1 Tax=Allokutzneria sp. A3M-2-11 16 TaxID=2962043 RepID=UPI0020B64483|nr:SseB family protein [Allokutzneria sp. A3M-2-11 16]MCP3802603.1 SseB family protein [Allokutzneria sp. A3M-2-11 16]